MLYCFFCWYFCLDLLVFLDIPNQIYFVLNYFSLIILIRIFHHIHFFVKIHGYYNHHITKFYHLVILEFLDAYLILPLIFLQFEVISQLLLLFQQKAHHLCGILLLFHLFDVLCEYHLFFFSLLFLLLNLLILLY